MIGIAVAIGPEPSLGLTLMKQCGVEKAVGYFSLQPVPGASADEQPWSLKSLTRTQAAYERSGLPLAVIE
ncbi:MAG: mannonate dehydratase, partial [Gemmatimonadota bacterium]